MQNATEWENSEQLNYFTTNYYLDQSNDNITVNYEDLLKKEIEDLRREVEREKKDRLLAEEKIVELNSQIEVNSQKRKRRTKAEMEELPEVEYSEYKSNGVRKAHSASPIRSYDDFKMIQDYFWNNNRIRDWMMWTVGVSLGLRISDLLSLKINQIINEDLTFKKRIDVMERKTAKHNNCLITKAVILAITTYFDSINWKFNLNDYLFKGAKTKTRMSEEYGWRILSKAGRELNLPINIGSHSMRKSFANIVACVDKSTVDMNAITKIQGLLNHSDQRVTMRYLGTFQQMYDKAREGVSDFVLGKSNVNELIAGNSRTIEDVITKLDRIEGKLLRECDES